MNLDHIFEAAGLLCAGLACGSVGYYILCLWSAVTFLRERQSLDARPTGLPPVSILKPLKGTDPEMYESFRSHCRQDYPEYEIVFGVSDADDPAMAQVRRLQEEFPAIPIRLMVCDRSLGANTKVSNLAQMLLAARHDILIVNDSDIRVGVDYLRQVVLPLMEPGVGMVTCLYRGIAAPTLGSKLEAIGISTDFIPGVLAARQLQGMHFALGSTMAFRRQDLQEIGGFEAFADCLADDYELGSRLAGLGKRIRLSPAVVETFLPAYSLRQFVQHQLRWARTIRDARPAGYWGVAVTFGLIWACLSCIFSGAATWSWALLIIVAAARAAVAWTVGDFLLNDRQIAPQLALIPLRDLLGLTIWCASFTGRTVWWRGQRFSLKRGKLTALKP